MAVDASSFFLGVENLHDVPLDTQLDESLNYMMCELCFCIIVVIQNIKLHGDITLNYFINIPLKFHKFDVGFYRQSSLCVQKGYNLDGLLVYVLIGSNIIWNPLYILQNLLSMHKKHAFL